ncbi:MAG TPA: aminotransferase class V-fold PLP-dependent enzyme [Gemmatimonadales bacterium]|nr:aminotransferase class V-fold PLP-dependent enzyme [Gemmatimonadales bacterium]
MSEPANLSRWRTETPGCATRVHLNNAGAGLMPQPVLDTITAHLHREAEIGGYEAADEAEPRLRTSYELIARLVGATPRNIAVVENATVAFSQALQAFDFHPGDVIVTTRADYPSNQLMFLSLAKRLGVEIHRAADLPEGGVDPDDVRRLAAHSRCRLVTVSWVPTNSGLVQGVAEVGTVCAQLSVPYLVDACQSVGQLPIDVEALHCDFLAATARKFLRGPRGIGFLYVSDRALEKGWFPLYLDMHGADWTDPDAFRLQPDARRFENWEFPYALVLGLGEAARYALEVGTEGYARARRLAGMLRERLTAVPGVRVTDRGRERCAIVTIAVDGHDAADLELRLRARGINTSSAHRTSGVIDMDEKHATSVLRLSPHYYNTESELEAAVGALKEELQQK